jgi:GAF domain-containing protein
MRRRSRTGSEPAKARRRNATTVRRRGSLAEAQETKFARLARERDEALDQLSAATHVLAVISSSPGDLKPVFQAILSNATRICDAKFGTLYLCDADAFRVVAMHNTPPAYTEARQREPLVRPPPDSVLGRVSSSKHVVHIADVREVKSYIERNPFMVAGVELGGYRTALGVPMLKQSALIGVVIIYRQEVRPFTDKQIELVKNFAAQAVIAIENTRLLNELRESLQQQTATADVLRIISSSPGELGPVFQAMLENATRICEAKFGTLFRFDGENFHPVAQFNTPTAFLEAQTRRGPFKPTRGTPIDHVMRTRQMIHSADNAAEPVPGLAAKLVGARSLVAVPMLKDDALIGAILIYRLEVRPFTDKQIELVKNFAAQAVIAIENTRLLNELRQRTADLTQSLEQQTATSEVLGIISSSPGELEPVFRTLLENATRLCAAKFGNLYLREGDAFRTVAMHNVPPAFAEVRRRDLLFHPAPGAALSRLVNTKKVVHVPDISAEQAYIDRNPRFVAAVELGGFRAFVAVPMFKEGELVGAIVIYRQEVGLFTDKQIELVQNFAAQAVIAIENTRLLNELRERTEQLEMRSQEVVKLNQQLEQRVADQVGEIERMSRLRRFLPPQVADLIVASGTEKQLESHRQEITALFCDLRGYTGFSESSDPEDVMALLRDYHAAIGEIIFKYSGTLERFAGDGVMVIFNDPVPVENPALQAVLMALEMRTAIGTMIEKWRDLGHDLGFGIGIAHGFATLGTIGFEGRFDYAAIGIVSNVASRLCDEAKPGQILISPRVRLAVDKAVTVEPVREFTLKGIRRPMTAYNVLASSASKPN